MQQCCKFDFLKHPYITFLFHWKLQTIENLKWNNLAICLKQWRFDAIWGLKVKIDYLILDAKLLLINVNYVEFFLFLEIL